VIYAKAHTHTHTHWVPRGTHHQPGTLPNKIMAATCRGLLLPVYRLLQHLREHGSPDDWGSRLRCCL